MEFLVILPVPAAACPFTDATEKSRALFSSVPPTRWLSVLVRSPRAFFPPSWATGVPSAFPPVAPAAVPPTSLGSAGLSPASPGRLSSQSRASPQCEGKAKDPKADHCSLQAFFFFFSQAFHIFKRIPTSVLLYFSFCHWFFFFLKHKEKEVTVCKQPWKEGYGGRRSITLVQHI